MNRKLKLTELNRVSVEGYKSQEKTPIIVILDNIRSLNKTLKGYIGLLVYH